MEPASLPLFQPDGSVVNVDPEIHSGTPVFVGTRVPIRTLVDYLASGYDLGEFLDHFPSVRREQAIALLEQAAEALLNSPAARGSNGHRLKAE
jgi:uncharacterized protein (DUF433 family)